MGLCGSRPNRRVRPSDPIRAGQPTQPLEVRASRPDGDAVESPLQGRSRTCVANIDSYHLDRTDAAVAAVFR